MFLIAMMGEDYSELCLKIPSFLDSNYEDESLCHPWRLNNEAKMKSKTSAAIKRIEIDRGD